MRKNYNQKLLEISILILYLLLFLYLIVSNKVLDYIHPRIIPFIKISVVIIACLIIVTIENKTRLKVKKSNFKYFILILPLVLITCTLYNDYQSNKYIALGKEAILEDSIIIGNNEYLEFIDSMESIDNKYLNKPIEIVGYTSKEFNNNEYFLLYRDLMTCCTADLENISVLCAYGNSELIKMNSWYKINGVVSYDKIKKISYIKVENITSTNPPENKYLYQF